MLALMDEGKSMLEVGTYHEYIVNLQGVTYQTDNKHENLTQVMNVWENNFSGGINKICNSVFCHDMIYVSRHKEDQLR